MIEVNLIGKKKKKQLPVVLGMDLNKVNWKLVAISAVFLYVPDWYIKPMFSERIERVEGKLDRIEKKVSKVQGKINQNKNVKKKLDAFNRQIKKLEKRSAQVEKIISQKTNPKRVLESLARNAPQNLWFNMISIDKESKIVIEGGAQNYKSIGDFIVASNDSPFFGKSLVLSDSQTEQIEENATTMRVEQFVIKGNVVTYNPFDQNR